jgi:hypothetical protein
MVLKRLAQWYVMGFPWGWRGGGKERDVDVPWPQGHDWPGVGAGERPACTGVGEAATAVMRAMTGMMEKRILRFGLRIMLVSGVDRAVWMSE